MDSEDSDLSSFVLEDDSKGIEMNQMEREGSPVSESTSTANALYEFMEALRTGKAPEYLTRSVLPVLLSRWLLANPGKSQQDFVNHRVALDGEQVRFSRKWMPLQSEALGSAFFDYVAQPFMPKKTKEPLLRPVLYSPLHIAVLYGRLEMVHVLLAMGGDPMIRCLLPGVQLANGLYAHEIEHGNCIHIACKYNQHQVLDALLVHFADPELVYRSLRTADARMHTPLSLAIRNSSAEVLRVATRHMGSALLKVYPLHDTEVAGMVLNPDRRRHFFRNGLVYSLRCGSSLDVVKLMVNPRVVSQASPRGIMPIHVAARFSHSDGMRLLLDEWGADPNALDRMGDTPLTLALRNLADAIRSYENDTRGGLALPSLVEWLQHKIERARQTVQLLLNYGASVVVGMENESSQSPLWFIVTQKLGPELLHPRVQVELHRRWKPLSQSSRLLQYSPSGLLQQPSSRFVLKGLLYFFFLMFFTMLSVYRSGDGGDQGFEFAESIRVRTTTEQFQSPPDAPIIKTFEVINNVPDMWIWLRGVVSKNFFRNGDGSFMRYNHLVTNYMTIRQVRVSTRACPDFTDRLNSIDRDCVPPYIYGISSSTDDFGPSNWTSSAGDFAASEAYRQPFRYYSPSDYLALFVTPSGVVVPEDGGFEIRLDPRSWRPDDLNDYLTDLEALEWIDGGTALTFVEMVVYNPSIDMLALVRLGFEMAPNAMIYPWSMIVVSRLFTFQGWIEILALCLECFIYIGYFFVIVSAAQRLMMDGRKVLRSYWDILDLCMILDFFLYFGFRLCSLVLSLSVDFSEASMSPSVLLSYARYRRFEVLFAAILISMGWVRMLKYLMMLKSVGVLFLALKSMMRVFFSWMVFAVVLIIGFGTAEYLILHSNLFRYRSIISAVSQTFFGIPGGLAVDAWNTMDENRFGYNPALIFQIVVIISSLLLQVTLIALLSQSYVKVNEKAAEGWNLLRAKVIISYYTDPAVSFSHSKALKQLEKERKENYLIRLRRQGKKEERLRGQNQVVSTPSASASEGSRS